MFVQQRRQPCPTVLADHSDAALATCVDTFVELGGNFPVPIDSSDLDGEQDGDRCSEATPDDAHDHQQSSNADVNDAGRHDQAHCPDPPDGPDADLDRDDTDSSRDADTEMLGSMERGSRPDGDLLDHAVVGGDTSIVDDAMQCDDALSVADTGDPPNPPDGGGGVPDSDPNQQLLQLRVGTRIYGGGQELPQTPMRRRVTSLPPSDSACEQACGRTPTLADDRGTASATGTPSPLRRSSSQRSRNEAHAAFAHQPSLTRRSASEARAQHPVRFMAINVGGAGARGFNESAGSLYALLCTERIDIAVIGETHLRPGERATFPLGDDECAYHVIDMSRALRPVNRRWGGVSVVVKARDNGAACLTAATTVFEELDVDVLGVRVSFSHRQRPLLVIGVYLPPPSSHSCCTADDDCVVPTCPLIHPTRGIQRIAAVLAAVRARDDVDIVLGGDVNADPCTENPVTRHRWDLLRQAWRVTSSVDAPSSAEPAVMLATCLMFNSQSSPLPTRVTASGAATLDHFLVSCLPQSCIRPLSLRTVMVPHLSDHHAVVLTCDVPVEPGKTSAVQTRAEDSGNDNNVLTARGTLPDETLLASMPQRRQWPDRPLPQTATDASTLCSEVDKALTAWQRSTSTVTPAQWRRQLFAVIDQTCRRFFQSDVPTFATRSRSTVYQRMYECNRAVRYLITKIFPSPLQTLRVSIPPVDACLIELVSRYHLAKKAAQRLSKQLRREDDARQIAMIRHAAQHGQSKLLYSLLRRHLPRVQRGQLPTAGTGRDYTAPVTAVDVEPTLPGEDPQQRAAKAARAHSTFIASEQHDTGVAARFDEEALRLYAARNVQRESQIQTSVHDLDEHQASLCNTSFSAEELEVAVSCLRRAASSLGATVASLIACLEGRSDAALANRERMLAHLNGLWTATVIDDDLVTAKVTPILKTAPPLPSNFRTIAVISVVSKLFQQLRYARLLALTSHAVCDEQAGFRQKRSVGEHHVIDDIIIAHRFAKGMWTYQAFLDLRRAYASVNREILMDVLWDYGVRGQLWWSYRNWFRRQQLFVEVDGVRAPLFPSERGVGEGSVESPWLFNLYFNRLATDLRPSTETNANPDVGVTVPCFGGQLPGQLTRVTSLILADDAKIYAESLQGLQAALEICGHSAHDRRMVFNVAVSKTAVIVKPGSGEVTIPVWPVSVASETPSISIMGEVERNDVRPPQQSKVVVPATLTYKYLGLIQVAYTELDKRFDAQLDRVARLSRFHTHSLSSSGITRLPLVHGRQLYQTYIVPSVYFGAALWGWMLPQSVVVDCHRVLRVLTGDSRLPIAVLHSVTGIPRPQATVRQLMIQQLLAFFLLPTDHYARGVVAAEFDACVAGTLPRPYIQSAWIAHVIRVLHELDDAQTWFQRQSHPLLVVLSASGAVDGGWYNGVLRLVRQTQTSTMLSPEEETALVSGLRNKYKQAVAMWELSIHVPEVRSLASVRDVVDLSLVSGVPPYMFINPSPANRLRTACRGGLRCVLRWRVFEAVGKRHPAGTHVPCLVCGAAWGSVTHLVRDCVYFETHRRQCWSAVQTIAINEGITGTALTAECVPQGIRHLWFKLTIGEDVPDSFLKLGLEDWKLRRHKCYPSTRGKTPEGTDHASESTSQQLVPWRTYANIMHVTGAFLINTMQEYEDIVRHALSLDGVPEMW